MANNSGMDNVEDLISLAQGNTASDEASVVEVLNSRYSKDLTYTRIGENIVVSVNPYKPLEANSDSSVKTYSSAAKEGTERRPHVFEVSANAFFNATKMKQNQSIVMM
jgi:myosin heavy subunit